MAEKIVLTDSADQTASIFGELDAHVRKIEEAFDVTVSNRSTEKTLGSAIVVSGDSEDVVRAARAVEAIKKMARLNEHLTLQNVEYVIGMVRDGKEDFLKEFDENCICMTVRGKPVKAKTVGQSRYVDAIRTHTVVLGVGPAGTGKTYLAVAMAVAALRNKQITRIVLTRPAVEAGERLGYLPGDLQSKIDPYLRPLYDALYDMLGAESCQRYLERGTIEIAPLAYMRGRTLEDAFIILDEAQNTTPEQMKMLLTRLGTHSRLVVTGDVTQTDLPSGQKSGLVEAMQVLASVEDIAVHTFSGRDVVRHRLVQQIIEAYASYESRTRQGAVEKERRENSERK